MPKLHKSNISLVSVIIPAYGQEKTIQADLKRIIDSLSKIRYQYEVVVVVDGFIDKTFQNAKKVKSSRLSVIGYQENHGKGYAIRFGMARAKGDVIAFLDSGMDINPNGISMLLEHFEWYNADVIVGSKLHPVSKITYPFTRKVLSVGYRLLVKILFGLSIRDTQAGLKAFRREVLVAVLPRMLVERYAFDIEMLAVARALGFKRIYEAPIEIDFTNVSSITSSNFWFVILHMLADTFAVFYRLKMTRYYYHSVRKQRLYPTESTSRKVLSESS